MVCFNTKAAAETSDWDVYEQRSMNGGIGYSEERLKRIFSKDFEIIEFREMVKDSLTNDLFGEDFLWTSLMQVK